MISLANRTAFITGAAGGIGSAMCALFAELGAVVIACDRDEASLNRLAGGWSGTHDALHPVVADTTDEQALKAVRQLPPAAPRSGCNRPHAKRCLSIRLQRRPSCYTASRSRR